MSTVPLFRDYALEVLKRREQDGVRGIYHEKNRYSTHIADAAFAAKPLDEITRSDLRDWLREMAAKPKKRCPEETVADPTIKRAWSLVGAVFGDAEERELIKQGPHRGLKMKRRADERSTRQKWTYFTIDEQKLLAKSPEIPECDRLTTRFAIGTGLRQGEQFHLLLDDIHVGANDPHVMVRFSRRNLPPKSGKIRRVPLFGDALVAARRWLYHLPEYAPHNPHRLVFPNIDGGYRSCGKPFRGDHTWRNYLKAIGIERRVRWHDCRHTFCTNLVTGVLGRIWPLVAVKEMAGHSSVMITEKYAHVGMRDLVSLGAESSFSHDEMPEPPPLAYTRSEPEWIGFDEDAWGVAS